MDITAISSIISSVVGFALLNAKKDDNGDDKSGSKIPGIDPGNDNGSQNETVTGKRAGAMYFGRDLDGGVYDCFYDYSPEAGEKLYFRREFIDNITSNEERVKSLRARIVAPFVTSELAGEDESFIGTNVKDINGYCNGLWLYRGGKETVLVRNYQHGIPVLNLAKGNVRNVTIFVEIFNPCNKPVRVEKIGVDDIKVGTTKCQMVHLTSKPKNLASRPTDLNTEKRSWRSNVYQNATDKALENKANEGLSDLEILKDKIYKNIKTGNQPYFAARELQIEELPSFATQKATWKPCEYPYDMLEDFLWLSSKASCQNPGSIFGGLQKYGISDDVFNYEYEKYKYEPKFLEIPAGGSVLVKMVMPLADMDESTVQFVKAEDIYRIHTSGADAGLFDELRTSNHYYYSIFPYEQYICSPSLQDVDTVKSYNIGHEYELERRENFFRYFHNQGVKGYCVFNIKPAPEINAKKLSVKLTLYGNGGDLHPKNDPVINAQMNSNGNQMELCIKPSPVSDDKDWRNSYYGIPGCDPTGPDESFSAKEQLNQYLFNTESDLGDYFDPSINN